MAFPGLSWARMIAILVKEFRQVRRDRLTCAVMVGVPIMQLVLFGFAINTDPRHLPLAVVSHDQGSFSRSFVSALQASRYFELAATPAGELDPAA